MKSPIPVPSLEMTPTRRWLITACTMVATLMQTLDSTIANVALPYMQGSLGASPDQITWVLTAYVMAAAIMTAPVGWLANRFGRRNVFVASLAGFTIASMLCGLAQSLDQIVAYRVLQGVFGAALVPLSQSTMLELFPAEQRGSAMAIWGMGVMVGPILGPTLGGYLTDVYDWRWVFFINLPFGIIAIVGLMLLLKRGDEGKRVDFDWLGFSVLSLGIGALQLMLDRGEQKDWFSSTEIITEAVLAGLGIYLFVVHLMTAKRPFISPAMFRDRNYFASLMMMFAVGVVLLASSALMPPWLQTLGGYSVTETGLLMAPRGIGTMAAMLVAGRIVGKIDPRAIMATGILMLCLSLWLMIEWTPDVAYWTLVEATVIQGAGLGFFFIPLQVVAFATLAPNFRNDATALLSLVRNTGSAIGVSITSFMLAQNTQIMHARIAEHVTPFNRMLQTGGAYLRWNAATPPGLSALNAEVTRQASIMAYSQDFMLLLLFSIPTLALLLLLKPMRRDDKGGSPAVEVMAD